MNLPVPPPSLDRPEPGPLDDWRHSLARVGQRRAVILERTPKASDGTELFECDLEIMALSALLGAPPQDLLAVCARGAGSIAASVLAHAAPEGTVLLHEPASAPRRIPVGPAGLTPTLWRDGLLLAFIARDREAIDLLTAPERVRACQLPPAQADTFWLPYCQAFAALATGDTAFGGYADAAVAQMSEAATIDPHVLEYLDRPLLELAQALNANQANAWGEAVLRALTAHRSYYADELHRYDRRGFLALGILGLCAGAIDRGWSTPVESSYLPAGMIAGSAHTPRTTVTFLYPTRRIARAEEAIWFLDLAGFPRADRSHRLVQSAAGLVARYEAHHAPHLPQAVVDFVYADDERATTDLPPAVDAGELLWLAERFATAAGDTALAESERRARLGEAIECIDQVLRQIHSADSGVRADSLRSTRGRSLYGQEPGRFRRERLLAYRAALARHFQPALATPLSAPAQGMPPLDAHGAAVAFIEIIRTQVTPILHALARDRSPEIIALLRPRDDDYQKVFLGAAIQVARQTYTAIWQGSFDMTFPTAAQTALLCHVAPAGMLAADNELARHFPRGYRTIACWLNPQRVWGAWKYVVPGQTSGLAFDGVVWCDDHWAWFPKPYRGLASLVEAR